MFAAMGTEPRLRIMRLLLSAHPEGMVVGDIGASSRFPSSTLSHHLEKLKNEGLVKVRREGTFLWYSRQHRDACRNCSAFSMRNAARATRRSSRRRVVASVANEGDQSMSTHDREGHRPGEVRPGGAARAGRRRQLLLRRRRGVCGRAATRSPRISTTRRRQASCPRPALQASLGCGNPTALAELKPGETVLDLGSGGGIDVLLSARRVGPDRQGLRPRHDRRDAGARRREQAQERARRTSSS